MAILILDNDPKKCAEYLDDKSLDKMIRDIAQVLCNVHVLNESKQSRCVEFTLPHEGWNKGKLIKWTTWANEYIANYRYLVELLSSCLDERFYRILKGNLNSFNFDKFNEIHRWARDNEPDLPNGELSTLPLVMPDKYLKRLFQKEYFENYGYDVIRSYRNYYQAKLRQRLEKKELHKDVALASMIFWWTNRNKPEWIEI